MNQDSTELVVPGTPRPSALARLVHDRRGATVVEYLVIVGLIAIACIGLFRGQFMGAVRGAVGGQAGQIGGLGGGGGTN